MHSKTENQSYLAAFGLRGVGKKIAKQLARLKIYSVQDLLFHLPSRYQDRTQVSSINQLLLSEEAVVEGVVQQMSTPKRGRSKLLCKLKDKTGVIDLRFFHILHFQLHALQVGTRLRCYGEVRLGPNGLEMVHPEFQVIAADQSIPLEKFLTPIYPTTEGLSQYMLRKLMSKGLMLMNEKNGFAELLPTDLLDSLALPVFKEALQMIHFPPRETSMTDLLMNKTSAQRRLIFEELLTHRMSLLRMKQTFQAQVSVALRKNNEFSAAFRAGLPFSLTQAQERVLKDIQQDLTQTYPMLRLVQGDVGSGKTVVAALAMLQVIENGYQAAMMAPTELLAEQHYRVFKQWLEPLGISVSFLSGNIKGRERTATLKMIANGAAQIILGTHALFQEEVVFAKLALVVVDEQHRFGVAQRALLREKGLHADYFPHQLVMTATPIPRTLAMSFYADLDCSMLDELPPGRTRIATSVLANMRREEIIARIRAACEVGRQVYWVCPLIDESDAIVCQAATKIAEELQQLFSHLKIGLIHGRMKATEKETVMRDFQRGDTHLLVATTVIEVGVDVPNASIMIIENAERLGLSQLHQLRGRVGRGSVASHCVLLYQHPLSELAKARLAVMRETTDGFKIAQRDLELRGPGEVLGTRQTGDLSFRIADLLRDNEMLVEVQQAAELIMKNHPEIIESLIKRWLGNRDEYGKV